MAEPNRRKMIVFMIICSFKSGRNEGDKSFVQSALRISHWALREFGKLQKTKITWHYRLFFKFRCSFENSLHYQNTLFSAIFKTHASAQGEIWSADWTKLLSPRFRPLVELQNIMKEWSRRSRGSHDTRYSWPPSRRTDANTRHLCPPESWLVRESATHWESHIQPVLLTAVGVSSTRG
jgi:hypothetical protein